MGLIRGELEDLSFRYLEPEAFFELQKKLATKQKVFDKFLLEVQETIRDKMVETGIPAEVQARVKRLYSLHLKIQKQQRTLDQVYDLLAVRVITDTVKNCYAALGVIHQIWRPVPGRFKDYIAMPRPNLYQSLHTTRDPRRAALRSADSHAGDASHRRAGRRRALEIQGRRTRSLQRRRSAHRLDAPTDRVGAGNAGAQRISLHAARGPVSRRGLHLHAEGTRGGAAARRHADRFCLRGAHRSGPSVHRARK